MKFCEKNVLCEKGDEITRFEGTVLCTVPQKLYYFIKANAAVFAPVYPYICFNYLFSTTIGLFTGRCTLKNVCVCKVYP
jgi:hypothetical protein